MGSSEGKHATGFKDKIVLEGVTVDNSPAALARMGKYEEYTVDELLRL